MAAQDPKEYTLVVAPLALRHIKETSDYIREELSSPRAAERFRERIISGMESLRTFPLRNPVLQDVPEVYAELRSMTIAKYRIVYTVQDSEVHILDVLYGPSDLLAALARGYPEGL